MADRLSSLLNAETRKPSAAAPVNAPADDLSDEVEGRSYSFVRGIRDRVFCVEFRLLAGNPYLEEDPAGDYALIVYRAWLRDGSGFRLEFAGGLKVTVRGLRLRIVYERLMQHRVCCIRELGADPVGAAEDDEPWVESVEVQRRIEDGEGTPRAEPASSRLPVPAAARQVSFA
jgi:hypothetical protein